MCEKYKKNCARNTKELWEKYKKIYGRNIKKNCGDQQQGGVYAESAAAGEGSSTAPIFAPRPTLTDDNHHHDGDDDKSSLMTITFNDDNDHDDQEI